MEMLPEQSKQHLKCLVVCGAQQSSQWSRGREFTAAHRPVDGQEDSPRGPRSLVMWGGNSPLKALVLSAVCLAQQVGADRAGLPPQPRRPVSPLAYAVTCSF